MVFNYADPIPSYGSIPDNFHDGKNFMNYLLYNFIL